MAVAVFFGGGTLLVNQAAISALLVVVLQPPDAGFTPGRFLAALIGSAVALAINYLFPANPERMVERAARRLFDETVRHAGGGGRRARKRGSRSGRARASRRLGR